MVAGAGFGCAEDRRPPATAMPPPPTPPKPAASNACRCAAGDWFHGAMLDSFPCPYSSMPVWKYSVPASAGMATVAPSPARAALPPNPAMPAAGLNRPDFPSIRSTPILSPMNSSPPAARVAPSPLAISAPVSAVPRSEDCSASPPMISPPSMPKACAPIPTLAPMFAATLATAILLTASAASALPSCVAPMRATSLDTMPAASFSAVCFSVALPIIAPMPPDARASSACTPP